MEQELPNLLQSYELRGKQPLVSDFSCLLRHATEKGRAPILYSKKKNGTPRGFSKFKEFPNDKNVTKQKPFQRVEMENIRKQERQIVARYARLTPSCKDGACTGQNSCMKNNKGH